VHLFTDNLFVAVSHSLTHSFIHSFIHIMSSSSQDPNSLALLIERLELATTQLEEIARKSIPGAAAILNPSPRPSASSMPAGSAEKFAEAITAYDSLLNGSLKTFLAKSKDLDLLISEQVKETFIFLC
jgi:Adenylate cyclase associated (CAP) N terminal